MTDEEINRAVAEHLGWKWRDHPDTLEKTKGWTLPHFVLNPAGELVSPHSVPNYAGDLNAMHEAEQQGLKTREDKMECGMILLDVCAPGEPVTVIYSIAVIACATARQRAEAFLRTVGKWRGNE